jgi:hypothetical protein
MLSLNKSYNRKFKYHFSVFPRMLHVPPFLSLRLNRHSNAGWSVQITVTKRGPLIHSFLLHFLWPNILFSHLSPTPFQSWILQSYMANTSRNKLINYFQEYVIPCVMRSFIICIHHQILVYLTAWSRDIRKVIVAHLVKGLYLIWIISWTSCSFKFIMKFPYLYEVLLYSDFFKDFYYICSYVLFSSSPFSQVILSSIPCWFSLDHKNLF